MNAPTRGARVDGRSDSGSAERPSEAADETHRPLIGVIGGLGPAATLDFYAKVIAMTPARTDQEHIRLLIDADPQVPNRNDSVAGTGPSSAPRLIEKARRLKAAGAEMLVMACNAAHAYGGEIVAATGLRLISIVDEAVTAAQAAAPGLRLAGVLAAAGALDAGLYREAFGRVGISCVEPTGDRRGRFMALLYRIKAGDVSQGVRSAMAELAAELVADGAQVVVAGCTEVPLVLGPGNVDTQLVDSTAALAAAVVAIGGWHGIRQK